MMFKTLRPSAKDPLQAGFGLLELLLVMVIVAVITVPALQIYRVYKIEQRMIETRDHIQNTVSNIILFNPLRYPCPANRALAPGAAMYGVEVCNPAAAAPVGFGLAAPTTANPIRCTADGGYCWSAGSRDLNGDLDTVDDNETVLIGGVPVTSLRTELINQNESFSIFSDKIGQDGWGGRMTYAVTKSMTDPTINRFFNGEIDVEDEFGSNTAGMNEDAHFVLISHGRDLKGAFLSNGVAFPDACGAVAAAIDNENCNNDAKFVQGLGFYDAASPQYYDDVTYVVKSEPSTIWVDEKRPKVGTLAAAGVKVESGNIYNLNTKNVGVSTDTPTDRLSVADTGGDADTVGVLRADNNVRTTKVCQKDGSDCFFVESFTGNGAGVNGIRCPNGQVMVGITNSNENCDVPAYAPPAVMSCPAGKWVHGIMSDGTVICWP